MIRHFLKYKASNTIYFVYGERYKHSGSTVMRGEQLSIIVGQALPKTFRVKYDSALKAYKGTNLVVTKGAIQSLNAQALQTLKDRGNRLLFDPVDSLVPGDKVPFADVIIEASQAAYEDSLKRYQDTPIALVDHHVDPRMASVAPKSFNKLCIGYFGELVNTFKTPKIERLVDFVQVDTNKRAEAWIERLADFNMHYTIRNSQKLDVHKPFLKGFTAAFFGANAIAHESQTDAVRWLGRDYPYLMRGPVTEKTVLEMLEFAAQTYGGETWNNALGVMENIKQKTSSGAIARQMIEALKTAGAM